MNEPSNHARSRPKINGEQWKFYQDWQRYILNADPKLPPECNKRTLIAFCHALAFDSQAGEKCFKGDSAIARQIGTDRHYLAKYRWLAVELEWLIPTGNSHNRVEELTINIPAYQRDVIELPNSLRAKDKRSEPPKVANARKGLSLGESKREPVSLEDDPWHRERVAREGGTAASTEPGSPFDQDES